MIRKSSPAVSSSTSRTSTKLSPSDFSFLYDECPCCFWRKANLGEKQPSGPMASIFRKIDSSMKGFFDGRLLSDLAEICKTKLPEGKIGMGKSEWVNSREVVPGSGIYISGKVDDRIFLANGSQGILDYKTSNVKPEYVIKYGRQLQAYAYATENPARGEAHKIELLGLACFVPETLSGDAEKPYYMFLGGKMNWIDIHYDRPGFQTFLEEVVALLQGDQPEGDPSCVYCNWKRDEA